MDERASDGQVRKLRLGCPTVLGADNGNLVIIGKLDVAAVEAVRQHIGEGETAVIIPPDLLLQAAKSLV